MLLLKVTNIEIFDLIFLSYILMGVFF